MTTQTRSKRRHDLRIAQSLAAVGCVFAAVGCALVLGCAAETEVIEESFDQAVAEVRVAGASPQILELTRDHIASDIYHYSILLRVGTTANARIRLHRVVREAAPYQPRATRQAVMMEHGDFASFSSNFISLPQGSSGHRGLAFYLAERGIDVWGMDRRWATTPADAADVSDFASIGFATDVQDLGTALAFARDVRTRTGAGSDKLTLLGFSSGGMLTYSYAGAETARPAHARHVKALVPVDVYARLAPENEAQRLEACRRRDAGRADIASGIIDIDNTFIQQVGQLAQTSPGDPSAFWPGLTNRQALLTFVGQTYLYFAPSPSYHLNGGTLENEAITGLRFSTEPRVEQWFIGAPPHQAYLDSVDMDAIQCNEGGLPLADRLADIRVPIFYLGAAGGYGDYGRFTLTVTNSTDVTVKVIRRLGVAKEAEDYGHADLLFAGDAPDLAWKPLAAWILRH